MTDSNTHPHDTSGPTITLDPQEAPVENTSALARIIYLIFITFPLIGLAAAIVLVWPLGFSWVYLALLFVMYILTGLGITVGYHRLFTHKSFETSRPMTFIIGVLGSMAAEGPILEWVAMHRAHHQHSDTEHDPHSPHSHGSGIIGIIRGFFHAHIGWMWHAQKPDINRYAPDLAKDPVVRAVSKSFLLWVFLGLLIPAVVAALITWSWWGLLLGLIWGGLARIFLVHHVTWSINSVCHIWGTRPFDSHDESRNNVICGVLGFGEGWHNNHHAFPTSARHGLRWWEIDTSYLVIRAMGALGLARNIRVPAPERIAAKRRIRP
ncbi:MAG: acyl-CoA desaturase [Phycisphaeraceae bacterium]|nr:MAG: acyl-CoA desaturase [Phycisphaeraceae bacterium]